jgi:hypothetical protein
MRDWSETMFVAVMMLRVVVLFILTVVCGCRRMGTQRFCWRATAVTSMLRGGLCVRPAAMRDRSGTMSVAVMMLRVFVLLFLSVVMRGDVVSQDGYTALLLACLRGHIDVARWLVSEAGSDARSERNNVCRCDDAACVCGVVSQCGMMWYRRMGTRRFCWRATTVTSMLHGGLCRRPAAMRDRSETMSVAVTMLRVFVVLFLSVV